MEFDENLEEEFDEELDENLEEKFDEELDENLEEEFDEESEDSIPEGMMGMVFTEPGDDEPIEKVELDTPVEEITIVDSMPQEVKEAITKFNNRTSKLKNFMQDLKDSEENQELVEEIDYDNDYEDDENDDYDDSNEQDENVLSNEEVSSNLDDLDSFL